MADLGNQKIKDTYQLVLQADASGNLQKLDGTSPSLIINSAFTYNVGTLVDGYVLKSNGSGVASWGALNADIYLSAATLNGTTLELDTTSGNTLSVDLSSLEGDSYWSANTNGSISPSGTSTPIKVLGNISGSSDLYLGDSTDPNPSIIAPTTLTLRGQGSGNDYLILQQDNVDIFIDGSTYVNVDPDSIILNSSSKAVNTAIMADDTTQLFYGDATNNAVRLKEHVFITPTGETSVDYSRALFVSGGSLFHSGGTNNPNEAIVAVGNISGTTDGMFGRNLGVSGRTYLGTIDAAGDSYSADKILVAQGGGEIEYLTTAQLKADIGDADYWTATTDGTSISPSGSNTTTTVKMSGDTFIKGDLGVTGLTNSNELSAQTLTAKTFVNIGSEVNYLSMQNQYIKWKTSNRIFISSSPSSAPSVLYENWKLPDNDYLYFGTGNDLSIYHNGTNSIIDNNTGTLQILASAITIGDTTSEVTINDNLVVDEDLTVNGTTLYVDSSNTKVGVGTTSPTHELTVSGGGAWIAWTEPTQINFVNGSSFFGYSPTDATVPTPLTIGGTTVRALVDGAYYYGTTTSPFFVNGRGYWGVTWAGSNVTLTDAEAQNCIAYGGVIPGNDKYFSVAAGDVIFQVSGSSIMSGSTDLVDIFASSAITNQDVYWTATTDGTGISPSGSNVTTTVRMSGDTHIKGNLGVSGNTYTTGAFVVGNATLNTSQLDISSGDFTLDVEGDITLDANGADIILSDDGTDFGRFKRDSSDFIIKSEGNNNDIVFRGQDAGVTRDALLLDMSDAGTATFNNGVNISGATSGRTDASFGGNLGISGKTFLDDNLRFSSAKQVEWVDSSTYVQGTTTQLVLNGDLNITQSATNQIKMTSTEMTNVGRVGISGDTNINGVLSGLTDARFGGNLGISGKTFLDDDLTVNGKGTFGDLSIETNGSNAILELERDSGGQLKLKAQVTSNRITYEGGPLYIDRDESGTNTLTLGTGGNISAAGDITASGRAGISGDTNINGTLSGLTDARFGGNLGVTGNTYFNGNISYPNARFFIQTTGAIKLLANNNWAGFNRTTGGLDSSGFWNVDTGSGTIGTAYNYYGSYRNTFFTVPYACKLTRMVIQGANTTNSEVGQDWNIHLAKSPVVDDSDSISWAAVTGVTKTLPDNRDKRFIYDISIDQNCSQFDTFFLAFQGTNSADTWLSMNVILEFEYTLT